MGLHLRQAMLINGMLFNSEAWHGLKESHINELQKVDNYLLRSLFKSHSKTSTAFMHLETGTLPLKFIISSRRLNFLHNILKRNDIETIHRVFNAQRDNPIEGDFINLVKKDLEQVGIKYDEAFIKSMNKIKFKSFIKKKIATAAFNWLLNEKSDKSKIKNIKYRNFKIQSYMSSKIFTNAEVELLSKLRSKNIDVKCNFKTKFSPKNNIEKLKCTMTNCNELETQEHLMQCKPILTILNRKYDMSGISYEDMFSKQLKKQRNITKLFKILIEIRTKLLK